MRTFLAATWRSITAPFRLLAWLAGWLVYPFRSAYHRYKIFWQDETHVTARSHTEIINDIAEDPKAGLQELLKNIFELRQYIVRALIGLIITTAASFFFAQQILAFLAGPIGGLENTQAVEVTESIGVFMRISLLSGFTFALPYILLEILLYFAALLKPADRRFALLSIPIVTVLFATGMAFAFFVMLGPALDILVDFMDIPTKIRPASYFPFVTGLMFWMGILFELPILIFFLSLIGLVRPAILLQHARVAIVLLSVLAAAITPTVDPVNMLLVWVPLVGIYFLGIGFAKIGEKIRRNRKSREEILEPIEA